MRPLNLAEDRIADRRRCRQGINRRLRIVVGLLILMMLVAAASRACRVVFVERSAAATSQLADAQKRAAQARRDLKSIQAVVSQREWQRGLGSSSAKRVQTLTAVVNCTPDDVWLSRVESLQKNSSIMIEGKSRSFESLTDFMEALRVKKFFKEVRLGSTTINRSSGSRLIDFSVLVKLQPNAAASTESKAVRASGTVPDVEGTH